MNRYGVAGLAALLGMAIASPVAGPGTPAKRPPAGESSARRHAASERVPIGRLEVAHPLVKPASDIPTRGLSPTGGARRTAS